MFEKEIEFKNLLTESEHTKIKSDFFQAEQPLNLINYYIDNKDLSLISHLLMLRIRLQDKKQLMTLKIPDTKHVVHEYSGITDLTLSEGSVITDQDIPENIREQLAKRNIDTSSLTIQGALETQRFEKNLKNGLLVLDKSTYLGLTDYELELEAPDVNTGQAEFSKLLEKYDIVRREEVVKSERFYNALKNKKGVL